MKRTMLVRYSVLALCLGTCLSLRQQLRTQEKEEGTLSPALATYAAAGLACAAIGSRLPYNLPAVATSMRRYLLTGLAAQTVAGTGISLAKTRTSDKPSLSKAAADVGYGAYNMAFVELARRLPYNTPARALFLRRYATFCLASQALGVAAKEYVGPAWCALTSFLGDHASALTPQQLEETAACLPFNE